MHRLFWGLFFVLLDLNLTVGRATFEVLPDFVGYFLLMKGMEELFAEDGRFGRHRHVAFGLFLLSLMLYGAGLLNLQPMGKVWLWGLELVCLAVFLWLTRAIVAGGSEQIRSLYLIVAVMQFLCHALGWVPLVGRICAAAALVTGVVFLIAFRKEMKSAA